MNTIPPTLTVDTSPTVDQLIDLELQISDEIEHLKKEIADAAYEIEAISPEKSIGQLSRNNTFQLYDMAVQAQQRRIERVESLNSALDRMDAGDYGECKSCRQNISWARLEAQPETRWCNQCADKSDWGFATNHHYPVRMTSV